MRTVMAPEWVSTVEAFGEGFGASVVVIGDEARLVAEAFLRAGAPPLAAESESLVVLGEAEVEGEPLGLGDLPPSSADLVVARGAWRDRAEVRGVIEDVHRVLRSGGRAVLSEFDGATLFAAPTVRYPSRLQYVLMPVAAERLRRRSAETTLLVEVARVGFRAVEAFRIDESRGIHADARSYWEAVREQGWPVFTDLSPEQAEDLLEQAAGHLQRIAPLGRVVDREPWFGVSGVKP